METAAGNLNPFLSAETTPRKKVKLQPRHIFPAESPAACGQEGQEIPGSVFESAVEGFASHRSEEQPVPVIQQPVPVVPQPGYIFPNSGLFYPSPAQGVPGPSVNGESLPQVNMMDRNFISASVSPVVNGEGVPAVNMRDRNFITTSVSPVVNGFELSCAIGTISPPLGYPYPGTRCGEELWYRICCRAACRYSSGGWICGWWTTVWNTYPSRSWSSGVFREY